MIKIYLFSSASHEHSKWTSKGAITLAEGKGFFLVPLRHELGTEIDIRVASFTGGTTGGDRF
jgi:hypothetical protein